MGNVVFPSLKQIRSEHHVSPDALGDEVRPCPGGLMSNVGRSEMSVMPLYGKSHFSFRTPLLLSAVVLAFTPCARCDGEIRFSFAVGIIKAAARMV